MDSELSSSLTSLDAALSTLTTSISTYNPSLPAADALIAADASLSKSLERCKSPCPNSMVQIIALLFHSDIEFATVAGHQSNHAHIMHLRARLSSMDEIITATLSTLATTRQELQSLAFTPPADKTIRAVGYKDLLSYAKKVAYTSIPPPGFVHPVLPGNAREEAKKEKIDASEAFSLRADVNGIYDQQNRLTALPVEELQRMKEAEDARVGGWTPWVGDELIRAGGLAGVDWSTTGLDGDAVKEEVKEVEEQKGEPIKEWQGPSNTIAPIAKEQPAKEKTVFGGLDLYDPDDD